LNLKSKPLPARRILIPKPNGEQRPLSIPVMRVRDGDVWEVDHIIPKSLGGKNWDNNLQLLHRHCHDTKTGLDGSLNLGRTYDKG
jgi:5-methylcytosine-specific restriction endonuclease McrA